MANKLVEKREELVAKRAQWHEIFASYPDLDMPAEVAADLKARNDEMTDLGKEVERLASLEDMAAKNAARGEWLERPAGGMVHPHGAKAAPATDLARVEQKSLGQLIEESAVVQQYSKMHRQSPAVTLDLPGLWGAKTLLTETGYAPQAMRTPRLVEAALQMPTVADLIPQGTTDQISVVYMEETTTTNSAAMVAEGAAKPESALAFTERTAPVRKIATVLPMTDELLADAPALRSYVEARLRLFLEKAEETELLSGANNTAPDFTGLLNATNLQTQAKGADPTPDAVYKAMVKIQTTAFLDPSGVIFHPLDWQDVRLLRTADGLYIWGAPMDPGPERIWGLPVVKTTAMTQNTALVGAFNTACQIFRRAGVTFAISDQNEDFFIKNKIMMRVEERLALAIYRGAAFCTVTGI
jgi:HK97 family phage major capsid protein